MTPEEARVLFDAAIDDELDQETRQRFEQALADNAELRAEFERHRDVVFATRALSREAPQVDLLAGVQDKLRARSGGRFYRDKFAEQRGRSQQITWMLAASIIVIIGALAFVAWHMF
jgi:anti-sigma factor RsiW